MTYCNFFVFMIGVVFLYYFETYIRYAKAVLYDHMYDNMKMILKSTFF